MALLLKFRILKFNSYSLDGSGEAVVEVGGQPSSGKTFFTIMLTKLGQNLENLRNPLGIFSCVMQTWHVKKKDLEYASFNLFSLLPNQYTYYKNNVYCLGIER